MKRMHLNNSVKDVTFHINSDGDDPYFEDYIKVSSDRLLTKYYFKKLTNINILFEHCDDEIIDDVFDQVLLNKEKLSSYSSSLKQVNFGFKRYHETDVGYVFSLYKNGVLEKNLNQLKYYKQMCNKMYDENIDDITIFINGNEEFECLVKCDR